MMFEPTNIKCVAVSSFHGNSMKTFIENEGKMNILKYFYAKMIDPKS